MTKQVTVNGSRIKVKTDSVVYSSSPERWYDVVWATDEVTQISARCRVTGKRILYAVKNTSDAVTDLLKLDPFGPSKFEHREA